MPVRSQQETRCVGGEPPPDHVLRVSIPVSFRCEFPTIGEPPVGIGGRHRIDPRAPICATLLPRAKASRQILWL